MQIKEHDKFSIAMEAISLLKIYCVTDCTDEMYLRSARHLLQVIEKGTLKKGFWPVNANKGNR